MTDREDFKHYRQPAIEKQTVANYTELTSSQLDEKLKELDKVRDNLKRLKLELQELEYALANQGHDNLIQYQQLSAMMKIDKKYLFELLGQGIEAAIVKKKEHISKVEKTISSLIKV